MRISGEVGEVGDPDECELSECEDCESGIGFGDVTEVTEEATLTGSEGDALRGTLWDYETKFEIN